MQRRDPDSGSQIEGYGTSPDIEVNWLPADLAADIDTQIDAAADFLRTMY